MNYMNGTDGCTLLTNRRTERRNPYTRRHLCHNVIIIIIIIIMSLFEEDNIFSASTNLTYGPHNTWLNTYYLQTVKIYIYISKIWL